jgi:carboxyl-terminal processing protease
MEKTSIKTNNQPKKVSRFLLLFLMVVIVAVAFSAGVIYAESLRPSMEKVQGLENKELGQPEEVDFSLFWDAWHIIEERFVDRNDLDRQNMVYGAITGMVNSLDDPYTVFMEPVESKKFEDDISGSFEGIGAEIGIRKGILTIIAPLKGTPADKAGVKAGDKILKIDETITSELTLDEAVNHIRGEKGTTVVLLIARDSWEEAKEISITRNTIKIPILDYEIKGNNVAYIQVYNFTGNLSAEFVDVVSRILAQQPRGIIIDLRNNPGGYLEVAVDLASYFLPKGDVVAIENFGNGEENYYRSHGFRYLEGFETVILINEGSASASEILAGALRDNLGVKIVGQKSFGKGSIQQLEKMDNGASLKVTVAKWLTPSGLSIQENGITPDFEVEITEEDIESLDDPQLEKALELFQ